VHVRGSADLSPEALRRLHREEISDAGEIRRLLERAGALRTTLDGGISRLTERRRARVVEVEVEKGCVRLEAHNFGQPPPPKLLLRFVLDDTAYILVANVLRSAGSMVEIAQPDVVYRSERRDAGRSDPSLLAEGPWRVELEGPGSAPQMVGVTDYSRTGLGVDLDSAASWPVETPLWVHFLLGPRAGEVTQAVLRHAQSRNQRLGWQHLGIELGPVAPSQLVPVENRDHLFKPRPLSRLRDSVRRVTTTWTLPPPRSQRIELRDDNGERIRGILDSVGEPEGAPLVILPPAWGRTKETLLPLALTLVETFRRAGQRVSVLRFDGIRRRGESHNDPECVAPGDEYLHFTVSQAVHDLHAVLDHVEAEYVPEKIAMVTSSISAVEGRRAIASDKARRVDGWVSLVGVADLRSSLREFSGGVDFGRGIQSGVEFGVQDLLGVPCDVDRLGRDALIQRLWFPEDARLDMEAIDIPICWIHGRYDGWMQMAGDRRLLSWGDTAKRRLIEIPTGHQLRTSDEAMTAFRLVAREVGRMLTGAPLRGATPDAEALASQQRSERRHLPAATFDLKRFWRDYLVGRNDTVGIELLTATVDYQAMMATQVEMMRLADGQRVADLGCGAGDFACHMQARAEIDVSITIDAYDFVPDALGRMRKRLGLLNPSPSPSPSRGGAEGERRTVHPVVANLAVQPGRFSLPCATARYDAVLCSLLMSYLEDAPAFLAEVHRILAPGGRLVLSSIRRDGDLSRIYAESLGELHPSLLRERFGDAVASNIESVRQTFLSDAARILDLEEFGYFRFWDEDELVKLVEAAGFVDVTTATSLGRPPQAIIVSASTLPV
jgi:ubiquinone/menaquinone biosynthesis C-methylase UbiE